MMAKDCVIDAKRFAQRGTTRRRSYIDSQSSGSMLATQRRTNAAP